MWCSSRRAVFPCNLGACNRDGRDEARLAALLEEGEQGMCDGAEEEQPVSAVSVPDVSGGQTAPTEETAPLALPASAPSVTPTQPESARCGLPASSEPSLP
jgi:hypothetical protein